MTLWRQIPRIVLTPVYIAAACGVWSGRRPSFSQDIGNAILGLVPRPSFQQ